jgi:hypothetical protein
LSRNLSNRISESSGLQICNKKITVKVTLTHRKMDIERNYNLNTKNPNPRKGRVMGSQKRILESGVSSTKSPHTTLMNVA